ncbi:MAG: cobaltochelatase subunit CobN, partial [Yoonia sp.]|uniref:cobaltochelatase subunit CobN n=1 Tax=Yoonia sp. TaxID=2212373 RepID=UPI00329A4C72
MHLLAATPGAIDDGQEPVDLGQTPADVIVISAADTELAALSEARAEMNSPPSLRLANMMHLQHPMSVDLHLDNCATKSRLVIARVLGGAGYWKYGLVQYAARLREAGVTFVALPGDDKPDQELHDLSTCNNDEYDALWSYLVEGGPQNSTNFLGYAKAIIDGGTKPQAASPLLRAGVYWPGTGISSVAAVHALCTPCARVVPIIFYRALVQGGGLNPINRLVKSLLRAGLQPMPIFVASLKDPLSVATLDQIFQDAPPSVILNCTAFAVGSPHDGDDSPQNPLTMASATNAPVFQVILSSASEDAWADSRQGLSPRDI